MVDHAYGDAQQPYVLRQLRATVDGNGDDAQNQINRLFKFATVDAAPGEIEQAVASDTFGYEFYQKVSKETQWLSEQARSGMTADHANTDWWAHGNILSKALLKSEAKAKEVIATPAEADGPTDTDPGNELGDELGTKSEKADFNPEDLDKAFDTPEEAVQKGSDGAAEATKPNDTPVLTPAQKRAKTVAANKAKKIEKK